jgi:branched-chain amino acid transport system substrate-binding protein
MIASVLLSVTGASAETKQYDTGATDTEVKVGQTMPFSGPLSSYATIGKLQSAYVRMLNERGGINGRRITIQSLDDGYSPPKTIEQIRRLVENDGVLFTFMTMGTGPNNAIHKYMNNKKVPMLFVTSGAAKWNDRESYPWTTGWTRPYKKEAFELARFVLRTVKDPRIAILRQNDDLGRDFVDGFLEGLGADAEKLILKEVSYQVSDPTIDSQIVQLKTTGANVFFDVAVSKFAAQAIRKLSDIEWKPLHLLVSNSSSISGTLAVAGLEKSKGIVSSLTYKDPNDPQWASDRGVKDYLEFLRRYYPDGDVGDAFNALGYCGGGLLAYIVEKSGDQLTRANVMKVATTIDNLELPMLLPGVTVTTNSYQHTALSKGRLAEFDGTKWVLLTDERSQ